MNYTPNYALRLPEGIEYYNVDDFNYNATLVDDKVFEMANDVDIVRDALAAHERDETNPHNVTKAQVGLGNVEDKSSETIRHEITFEDVVRALGFIPGNMSDIDCGGVELEGMRFQILHDASNNWIAANPVLRIGELGYDTTNKILKIGDSTHTWTELPGIGYDLILNAAKAYTDQVIEDLVGQAPAALDTIYELAEAIQEYSSIIDALNAAITNKADKTVATQSANGLMSATDKTKLDGIATGANNYTHPNGPGYKHIPTGGSSGKILGWYSSGTAQWIDPSAIGGDITYTLSYAGNQLTLVGSDSSTSTVTIESGSGFDHMERVAESASTVFTALSSIDVNDSVFSSDVKTHLDLIADNINVSVGKVVSNGTTTPTLKIQLTQQNVVDALGYDPASTSGVTGVKGDLEQSYRTGNVNITPANIGLGNVGNFKAVSTSANQGLSETEKANARANIGAGSSGFSGDYNDLTNKPTLGTASSKDSTTSVDTSANLPTANAVKSFVEGKGFITNAVNDLANYYKKTETYTQAQVNALVSAIPKFSIEVVSSLPTTGISSTTIYLLSSGSETQNLYTEYIYVNNNWEKLGTQTVDLSGYIQGSGTSGYIAKFNGSGSITNGPQIGSSTTTFLRNDGTWATPPGTNYTQGTGISISSNQISLASGVVTAGSAGPTGNVTGSNNATIKVPRVTVDTYGRVTGLSEYTLTNKDTTYSTATTSANGLMSSTDKTKLDGMVAPVRVSGTLAAGSTSLTLTNAAIQTTSYVQIYTSKYGLVTLNCVVSNGSCTLTYEAQESAVTCEIWVYNFT